MQTTRPAMGEGAIDALPEWQKATAFSNTVEAAATTLALPEQLEWLRFLLLQSGATIPAVLASAWKQQYLADYLLGLYEALDHVALLEYYLLFLRDEAWLTAPKANALDNERRDVQETILSVIGELRDTWRTTYELQPDPITPEPGAWTNVAIAQAFKIGP